MMPAHLKPVETKLLEGGANHNVLNIGPRKNESVGSCPVAETKAVKEIWGRCKDDWELLLTVQDRSALLMYCRTQAQYDDAYSKLNTEGAYDFNSHGRAIPSMWATRVVSLSDQLLKIFSQFGVTPVSRNRVPGRQVTSTDARKGGLDLLS